MNVIKVYNLKFKYFLKLQMIPGFNMGGGLGRMGGMNQQQPESVPKPDTYEKIFIYSLALLKMLKHCRAGVPLEVMGLMLG